MAGKKDDDHLFEDMTPESPGTIDRNIIRRLGLASQVAEAIRSPNNNTCMHAQFPKARRSTAKHLD